MQAVMLVSGTVPWGVCGESEELRDDMGGEPLSWLSPLMPGEVPPGEEIAVLKGGQTAALWP